MEYSETYFFGVSLLVAAVLNLVLAGMLWFDSNNYIYTETPRYLRSRRLTGLSLMVFGLGFLLHWLFAPHFTHLLAGKALSFSYFHIGGVLLSMSHTSLIDRHYLTRQVVVRDVIVLLVSLTVYWTNARIADTSLTYVGSALFFLHIGYLTWQFYSHFIRIYRQLKKYADYMPNDTDHEMLWLHYSCHLIVAFGIGGMLCTVVFHDATLPFTLLLFAGIFVFSYIYKALDSFGAIAREAEENLKESEEYAFNNDVDVDEDENEDDNEDVIPVEERRKDDDEQKMRIEQWVEERRYTDPNLTLKAALRQMDIKEQRLNLYLEYYTDQSNYRQWLPFLRVEEAKRQLLLHPDHSLQNIANETGYSSSSTLSRAFKSREGLTPMEWLRKQESPAPKAKHK